eukprot:TRINITY_DN23017_c0_g1_i1.p1 TRINITY_DN23017_c0_g1~~TRINITY_DN23017_c0_g1_i1.p1  ORF type:complete len:908 (-),score=177.57 TRINITY_DN23017_c0_g1_i1:307-3030(-)
MAVAGALLLTSDEAACFGDETQLPEGFESSAFPPLVPKRHQTGETLSVDAQLHSAAKQLEAFKQQRRLHAEEPMQHVAPPFLADESKATADKADKAEKFIRCHESSEYREMCAVLDLLREHEDEIPTWQRQTCHSLRGLLTQVSLVKDPGTQETQLKSVYSWFKTHKQALHLESQSTVEKLLPHTASGRQAVETLAQERARKERREFDGTLGTFLSFQADEDNSKVPGSGAFGAARAHELAMTQEGSQYETGTLHTLHGNEAAAQLPSARERLKDFKTQRLVCPLNTRKLKAAQAEHDDIDKFDLQSSRPMTPSTATGGCSTSRSYLSARSTPTPGRHTPTIGSRPSSAMSYRMAGASSVASASRAGAISDLAQTVTSMRAQVEASSPSKGPSSPEGGLRQQRPRTAGAFATEKLTDKPAPFPERPTSAHVPILPLPQQPTPCSVAYLGHAAYGGAVASFVTPAEVAMEERWINRRNKEISAQILGEEQRAAVESWAQSRARVEEEILRNAEVIRYQSQANRRKCTLPADAEQDIRATTLATVATESRASPTTDRDAELSEMLSASPLPGDAHHGQSGGSVGSRSSLHSSECSPASDMPAVAQNYGPKHSAARSTRVARPNTAPGTVVRQRSRGVPRYDVSEPGGRGDVAASAMKLGLHVVQPPQEPRDALGGRVAEIRRLHAKILAATGDESDGEDAGERTLPTDSVASLPPAGCIFDREEPGNHLSLSAYTAAQQLDEDLGLDVKPHDELDVLAGVSELWRNKEGLQDARDRGIFAGTLGEIRFQQIQEVQAIKRVFARSNVPVDVGLLERALVIPAHKLEDAERKYYEALRTTYQTAVKKAKKKKKTKRNSSKKGTKTGKAEKQGKAGSSRGSSASRSKSPGKKSAKGGNKASKDKSSKSSRKG